MSSIEERALAKAEEGPGGGEWGYRVTLEVGETFVGRYRGETVATGGDYGDQTLYLLWDKDGAKCYMRGHASLKRQFEEASPSIGATVGIARSKDYQSGENTGYSYGVVADPNDDPLPEDVDW